MDDLLLESILDSLPEGIYVLDSAGNYLFANSAYLDLTQMEKSELMAYNVHDFLREKLIDVSISDMVYRQKRRVAMLQDVFSADGKGEARRHLVISTPLFGPQGEVRHVVAMVRPVDTMNDYYYQAQQHLVASFVVTKKARTPVDFIAESPVMQGLVKSAETIAQIDSAILISGESGTGKEVLARFIHDSSPRKNQPFVVVNCASLPANLIESELFGYERGSFTGALSAGKKGYFEEADGGTLFLDEINSLPLDMQGKLLRAIETKQIQRVGSTKSKSVDFRIVTATNEDLSNLVRDRRFRADLYYRLNVIPLNLPPLRERREDIMPLALHFLRHFCKKYSRQTLLPQSTLSAMLSHAWPGNVRELRNFIERSVIMSAEGSAPPPDLEPPSLLPQEAAAPELPENDTPAGSAAGEVLVHNFAQLLESGVTLSEFIKHCGDAYVSFALSRYPNTYQAAEALGTSQSSVVRRKNRSL